jgi:histidine ammonia-lyase
MPKIKGKLGIDEFYKVIFKKEAISVDDAVFETVEKSFEFLKEFSKNKVIYGVNTGFGPMAQYKIKDSEGKKLQYNLIRSHASGSGNPIAPKYVKAAMLARLNTLSLGHSGVDRSVIEVMTLLINKDITPLIYEHGGVGASGDLVQLAHLALVLIGEGEVFYKGDLRPTKEVFELEGISPISVQRCFRHDRNFY